MRGSRLNKRLGQNRNGQEISARGIKGQTEREAGASEQRQMSGDSLEERR